MVIDRPSQPEQVAEALLIRPLWTVMVTNMVPYGSDPSAPRYVPSFRPELGGVGEGGLALLDLPGFGARATAAGVVGAATAGWAGSSTAAGVSPAVCVPYFAPI